MAAFGKQQCVHCRRPSAEAELKQCPICFKQFCEMHEYEISGRLFCSDKCAHYYFFVDPDADEDD